MSGPDFTKPGESPFTPPGGAGGPGAPTQPAYGTPGQPAYGAGDGPAYGSGAAVYGGGTGPAYGSAPYGTPAGAGAPVGPDGSWIGPPLAGWGARVGGALVDGAINVAVVVVLSAVSQGLSQVGNLAVLLVFGYLTGTTGQTPGRRLLGTRVLRVSDGQVLGAGAGIGRGFLHILDALSLGLGYLWPLWDRKKQTFADKAIGSVVVRVPR